MSRLILRSRRPMPWASS